MRKCEHRCWYCRTCWLTMLHFLSRYRYLAYRNFVSWCWGFLGRKIRVVIPSCVVLRIHREFPDAHGRYGGFKPPSLDWIWRRSWRWPPPCLNAHILKTVPLGCLSSKSLLCTMLGRQRPSPWSCPSNHSHTLCNTHKRESLVTRLFNNCPCIDILHFEYLVYFQVFMCIYLFIVLCWSLSHVLCLMFNINVYFLSKIKS